LHTEYDACAEAAAGYLDPPYDSGPSPQDIYDGAVPSWFIGLTMHLLLGAGALTWAWHRTRTPATRLPVESRIA
jgi:hypothetical protein